MSASRGDEKVSAAVRINPYAVKKVEPSLFCKPLVDYDDFEDEEHKMTNHNPIVVGDTDNTAAATTRHEEGATVAPMSVSLPLWKRLPSKSISFGSSEILTVSELCQHALLYYKATHSIRTTGVLRQKIYYPVDGTNDDSGEVSLLLEDPLVRFSASSNTRSVQKGLPPTPAGTSTSVARDRKGGRRISFGPSTAPQTPANAPSKHQQTHRPSLGGVARGSTAPDLAVTPAVHKTAFHAKVASRTPLQFRTPGVLSSRKRPLTPKTVCLKETLANALASNSTSTVWVVLDPQHVPMDHIAVGDLVTIFGTVHPIVGDESGTVQSAVPPRLSPFVRDVASLLLAKQSQEESEASNNICFVQARILRQDNGASPRLHWEALKLRRNHLLKTYYHHQPHPQQGKSQMGHLGEDVPFLGCGPPPYDLGTTEKSSGDGTGVTQS
jgi:hypothetical protein